MHTQAPQKPASYAEQSLVTAILQGEFPPGGTLPGERDLATLLGVTRPTLREVLQQLDRDGWITIQHGKPTRVNDYWRMGGLNVLGALVRYSDRLPTDFIPNLLEVRLALAPAYTRAAIERQPDSALDALAGLDALADTPLAFAAFDWQLHRAMTLASGNPVYTLILNGFAGFYEQMARQYFTSPAARTASLAYYQELRQVCRLGDALRAEALTRQVMQASMQSWFELNSGGAR